MDTVKADRGPEIKQEELTIVFADCVYLDGELRIEIDFEKVSKPIICPLNATTPQVCYDMVGHIMKITKTEAGGLQQLVGKRILRCSSITDTGAKTSYWFEAVK